MLIKRSFTFLLSFIAAISCFAQFSAHAGPDIVICPGVGATIGGSPSAQGGVSPYKYSWQPSSGLSSASNPNPLATPSVNTTYTLTITDDTGAVRSDVVTISINDIVHINAGRDTSICELSSASIGTPSNNYPGVTYSWSPGSTLNDSTSGAPVASPGLKSITYTLTASTAGCPNRTDRVTVTVIPTPPINAGPDTTIHEGAVAILHGSGGFSYAWGNTPEIVYQYSASCDVEPTITTTYYLYGTDETGKCPGYDNVTVTVIPDDEVVIYNTFTPNGDGNNDNWYMGNILKYPDNKLEVYNRYGKLVYKVAGYVNTWDGRVAGEELPSGTYFYDLDLGTGFPKYHGTVTIVK